MPEVLDIIGIESDWSGAGKNGRERIFNIRDQEASSSNLDTPTIGTGAAKS